MLHQYLNRESSVTERLAIGAPAQDVETKRVEVQARLDQWQAAFGRNAMVDEWQRSLDMARTYVMVEVVMRQLDVDLRQ